MPNHITNVIEFNCSKEKFEEIADYLRGDNKDKPLGHMDFNTLVPMPEELSVEAGSRGEKGYKLYLKYVSMIDGVSDEEAEEIRKEIFGNEEEEVYKLGKAYYENIRKYGAPNWYEWCIDNWNTKWNAYECEESFDNTLRFLTAWDGVTSLVGKISEKYPDVEIVYSWADEDYGYNLGRVTMKGGNIIGEYYPEEGSKEANDFAAEVLGYTWEVDE